MEEGEGTYVHKQKRIIEDFPNFVPRKTSLEEKLAEWAHYQTAHHAGVNLSMTKM